MLYPEIKHLYKYYSPDEEKISSVLNEELYFSNPKNFNDPFDSKLNIVVDSDPTNYLFYYAKENKIDITKVTIEDLLSQISDLNGELKEELKNEYQNSIDYWIDGLSNVGISCFTTDHTNQLMWAHYTKNHSGFCVKYKRYGILADLKLCFPIKYTKYFPTAHYIDFINSTSIHQLKYGTKSKDWAYENEWRAIAKNTGISDYSVKYEGIYFGCNAEDRLIERFYTLRDKSKIKLYKAFLEDNEYSLRFREITVK